MRGKTFKILRARALTALVFVCCSCASKDGFNAYSKNAGTYESTAAIDVTAASLASEAFGGGVWITRPAASSITVIGIAGRRLNRDAAINEALTDAARRVSLYHGLYGEASSVINQGTGLLEYYAASDYHLFPFFEPASYLDSLIFDKKTDVLEKEGSVYVRARFSGVSEIPPYFSTVYNGVPSWVAAYTAYIPGYRTGIGVSKNKGSPQKTYQASYELAVVSLLSQLDSRIEDLAFDLEGRGRVTGSTAVSKGRLFGIMILETWFDRKNGAVWTLAATKED